jgi:hypothetical protein
MTLEIYNSQGKRFDTEQPTVSSRIEDFFFAGVRLYVDLGREIELVAFFRARESKASRAEQYYAVYRTDSLHDLFGQFTATLREEIEDTHGMLLETSSDDVQLFAGLSTEYAAPGSHSEHDTISTLLSEGKQLRFGVSTFDEALGLLQKYLDDPATRIAIAEDAGHESLDDCDLAIELGSDESLEPLGTTETMLAQKNRHESSSSRSRPDATETTERSRLDKLKGLAMPVGVAVGTFIVLLLLVVIGANVADLFVDIPAVFDEFILSGGL